MTTSEKKREVREHLAVVSTEVYLLLKVATEDEWIDVILHVIDDNRSTPHSNSDVLFQ